MTDIVEYNPFTGIEITYRLRGGGKIDILQRQRCDGVLDAIGRRRSASTQRNSGLMGCIPNGLAMQWAQEEGVNLWTLPYAERMAFWKRKLNDPDYSKLRVNEGTF